MIGLTQTPSGGTVPQSPHPRPLSRDAGVARGEIGCGYLNPCQLFFFWINPGWKTIPLKVNAQPVAMAVAVAERMAWSSEQLSHSKLCRSTLGQAGSVVRTTMARMYHVKHPLRKHRHARTLVA